jgi:hypothetical protein
MEGKIIIPFSRWCLAACFLFALAGCSKESTERITEDDTAQEKILSEVNKLIAVNSFTYKTEDLSNVEMIGQDYTSGDISFENTDSKGFTLIATGECTDDSPASCQTIGSLEHMRVNGSGMVHFDRARTLLGLYISLSKEQSELLKGLEPQQGGGIFLELPQLHVLISSLDQDGEILETVRTIPASATYAETRVEENWYWIDASLLGQTWGLMISVTSPIAGLESILIDNLTISDDFEESDDFFTIALIPDTQKYSEKPELHEIFDAQTRYLAENKSSLNLVFASHLGDIVENGDLEPEWMVADHAMSYLDGAVPYGIVIGNHDFQDEWNNPQLGSPLFNKYFPEERFSAYPWWGGFSPDTLSSYCIFPTSLGDFLYLHLSVDSPPPTVAWAQQILDGHPGMPSLVTTHAYLREDGRFPVPYLSGLGGTIAWDGISADELFENLIAPNDQVFMVTCGHISAEKVQVSQNLQGNEVIEMLQDYQNRVNGGEGFLRLLQFYPGHDRIRALTYSPWLKTYEMDEDSFFSLEMDFSSRLGRIL